MSETFAGFPDGRMNFTPVPNLFFSEVVGQIDDLAELKLVLHCIWRLYQKKGHWRYLREAELRNDGVLVQSIKRAGQSADHALTEALEGATAREVLLQLSVTVEKTQEQWYFLNTARSRKAIEQIRAGELAPAAIVDEPDDVTVAVPDERPNIFTLYEENIGLLQPVIAEELRDAAETYPDTWIEDAFRIAAENNVRNWRYIRAILKRWTQEGRDSEEHPKHFEGDRAEQTRRRFLDELD